MANCAWCKEKKDASAFYACQQYVCKECVKERARRWYKLNTAKGRANAASYAAANPEKAKEASRRWTARNRAKISAAQAVYRERHPGKRRETKEKWRKANMGRYSTYSANRKGAKLKATPSWANHFFIEEIYDLAARRTALKTGGVAKWHVDHIVPLQSPLVCGLHVENNLQVIPALVNLRKHNKTWPDMPI
jgi:hypothetical protein